MNNHQHLNTMHIDQGRLYPAEWLPSANENERGDDEISLLVIHNISLPANCFGTEHIRALFQNRLDTNAHPSFKSLEGLEVSSHLLIERSGHVVQFVNFERRAWHAGVSRYQGREQCNDFSIGIELEGGDLIPYTAAQYQALAQVTKALMTAYPRITPSRITGHEHIAPDRKTDPGSAFDWQRLFRGLAECRS